MWETHRRLVQQNFLGTQNPFELSPVGFLYYSFLGVSDDMKRWPFWSRTFFQSYEAASLTILPITAGLLKLTITCYKQNSYRWKSDFKMFSASASFMQARTSAMITLDTGFSCLYNVRILQKLYSVESHVDEGTTASSKDVRIHNSTVLSFLSSLPLLQCLT